VGDGDVGVAGAGGFEPGSSVLIVDPVSTRSRSERQRFPARIRDFAY